MLTCDLEINEMIFDCYIEYDSKEMDIKKFSDSISKVVDIGPSLKFKIIKEVLSTGKSLIDVGQLNEMMNLRNRFLKHKIKSFIRVV